MTARLSFCRQELSWSVPPSRVMIEPNAAPLSFVEQTTTGSDHAYVEMTASGASTSFVKHYLQADRLLPNIMSTASICIQFILVLSTSVFQSLLYFHASFSTKKVAFALSRNSSRRKVNGERQASSWHCQVALMFLFALRCNVMSSLRSSQTSLFQVLHVGALLETRLRRIPRYHTNISKPSFRCRPRLMLDPSEQNISHDNKENHITIDNKINYSNNNNSNNNKPSRKRREDRNVGGYDPSEKLELETVVNVGNPQIRVASKERSVTSILRELSAIQQQGPQKYCILGTRHCSFLHQQIIELL
jgi:hypothetical protein